MRRVTKRRAVISLLKHYAAVCRSPQSVDDDEANRRCSRRLAFFIVSLLHICCFIVNAWSPNVPHFIAFSSLVAISRFPCFCCSACCVAATAAWHLWRALAGDTPAVSAGAGLGGVLGLLLFVTFKERWLPTRLLFLVTSVVDLWLI